MCVCVSVPRSQLHQLMLVDFDEGCGVCVSSPQSVTQLILIDFDEGCGVYV